MPSSPWSAQQPSDLCRRAPDLERAAHEVDPAAQERGQDGTHLTGLNPRFAGHEKPPEELPTPLSGYPLAVGTNAVRLIQADHRRIGELVRRLGRPYRAGESLRVQAAAELRAHVETTRDVLLPFAIERLTALAGGAEQHEALLQALVARADELGDVEDPVPADLAQRLVGAWERHVEQERPLLGDLGHAVEVHRLRILGDALRRGRDSALRTALRGTSRLNRPMATRAELYERARRLQIEGRSSMSRAELQRALEQRSDA